MDKPQTGTCLRCGGQNFHPIHVENASFTFGVKRPGKAEKASYETGPQDGHLCLDCNAVTLGGIAIDPLAITLDD